MKRQQGRARPKPSTEVKNSMQFLEIMRASRRMEECSKTVRPIWTARLNKLVRCVTGGESR